MNWPSCKDVQGDWSEMHTYAEQLLAISQELGDKGRIQDALWQLGESLSQSGDRQAGSYVS